MASKRQKLEHLADEPLPLYPNPDPTPETLFSDHATAAPDTDADDEEEEENISDLLEPLSRDQLLSLLAAAASDPHTLAEIRAIADRDPSQRKLFVHGLGWDTTADGLRAAFSSFGEIDDCRLVADKVTGRSKGYGFILFRHRASARRALRRPQRLIDNRMTACQLASSGPPPHQPENPNPKDNLNRKIYVGNVHSDVDGARLRAFFDRYGEIEEGPIGFDRQTGKPKGFALFVYRTVEGAHKALEEPNKNFEGHLLFCQKASSRSKTGAGAANVNTPPNAPVGNAGGFNGSGYVAPTPDMGMAAAQQAAMMGQGMIGMGTGMQPNAMAFAAMLASAGQNPAAFGFTPAMLASVNPAFAAMLGAGAAQGMAPVGPSNGTVQGYGVGNVGGYQNVGFQGHGFQGPPGFSGPQQLMPNQGGGGGSYQGGLLGQVQMTHPPSGPMGGYGPH